MRCVWIGLLIALLPALPAAAGEGTDEVASEIDTILTKASGDGSGFAVIVEVGGEVIFDRGYGYANREKREVFTLDTIAQIGSLTKQFTATAVLELAAVGKIDLEAPIGDVIPGLTPPTAEITPHQLLTHSSGLPEYCGGDFDRVSRDEFIKSCLSLPLLFAPGSDFAYSNVGYGALALVVEFVTGENLEKYLVRDVLRPNGLDHTGYLFPHGTDAQLARGYLDGQDMGNIADRIRALDGDWWNLKGNGGMQASTRDMYHWYRVLTGRAEGALADDVRAELRVPHAPWKDGVAEGYGWFFRSRDNDHVDQMSHAGSDGVFFAYYWDRPDEGVFLYFVGNSGEKPATDVLRAVRRVLYFRYVEPQ